MVSVQCKAVSRLLGMMMLAGAEPMLGTPEDFGTTIRNEVEFWMRAAQMAKYVPD